METKSADTMIRLGLIEKLIFGAGAIVTALTGNAKADGLWIKLTSSPNANLYIEHDIGAKDGYDASYDATFLPRFAPTIDFYSKITGNNLSLDTRPADSFTTINSEIDGRGLSGSKSGNLSFQFYNLGDGGNLSSTNIFADLYNSTGSLVGTYNVKDYATNGWSIPLTISNGLSYTMDVRFEPNEFGFKELADFASYWLQMCDSSNNKCEGLGEDGECLNFVDFAYWANKWMN